MGVALLSVAVTFGVPRLAQAAAGVAELLFRPCHEPIALFLLASVCAHLV